MIVSAFYKRQEMYSRYKRQRILHFTQMGYKPPTIWHMFREKRRIVLDRFIQQQIVFRSFYFVMNCSRTVWPFRLKWGGVFCTTEKDVPYLFCFVNNRTITSYCLLSHTLGYNNKTINYRKVHFVLPTCSYLYSPSLM